MTDSAVCKAGAALETLVHQFSDPLSFYRELIQNSLDANSRRVDVTIGLEDGMMVIVVADSGEGMNAEIIDTRLTRLFSSGKEGDLTRIGRFGIGFVSVFAVEPQAVVVDTSREGENWRMVFKADRTFVRLAMDEPVDGTRIRLYKPATAGECDDFVRRSREAIRYWCRHVLGEIRFQGEVLNEPFGIDSPCTVHRSRPGTEIAVGYARDGQPFLGLYNGGLTLMESRQAHALRGLAAKVNSRYLEHTLTRDGVVQDARFAELMAEVRELASTELPDLLLEKLEERVLAEEDADFFYQAAAEHFGYPFRRVWRASELSHRSGELDGEDWLCRPHRHPGGHVLYGPYTTELPPGRYSARTRLKVECPPPDVENLCQLEVYDAASERVLASRWVRPGDLARGTTWTDLALDFAAAAGQRLEFRTMWAGTATLRVRQVEVVGGQRVAPGARPAHLDRVVFRSAAGGQLRLGDCLDVAYTAPTGSPLVRALPDPVVRARPGDAAWRFLEVLRDRPPLEAAAVWCLPRTTDPAAEERAEPLREAVRKLLKTRGARVSEVRLAELGSGFGVALAQSRFGEPVELAEAGRLPGGLLARPVVVALNADHPLVDTLISAASREPFLCAYLLVKRFLQPAPEDDAELALAAWRVRCR
ncbi:MAG: ATP-binding protein [Armatimonadetes bacterium]|nr:ATP-binding protein [Armatimonadota bacterium]